MRPYWRNTSTLTAGCILGLSLVLAGCKSDRAYGFNKERVNEARAAVEQVIDEPERQAEILAVLDAFEEQVTEIESEVIAIRARIIEANRDYDTTRQDLELLHAELGQQLRQLGETVKRSSLEAKSHCSAEEWKTISNVGGQVVNFKF